MIKPLSLRDYDETTALLALSMSVLLPAKVIKEALAGADVDRNEAETVYLFANIVNFEARLNALENKVLPQPLDADAPEYLDDDGGSIFEKSF